MPRHENAHVEIIIQGMSAHLREIKKIEDFQNKIVDDEGRIRETGSYDLDGFLEEHYDLIDESMNANIGERRGNVAALRKSLVEDFGMTHEEVTAAVNDCGQRFNFAMAVDYSAPQPASTEGA